jgi:hypothetical protein
VSPLAALVMAFLSCASLLTLISAAPAEIAVDKKPAPKIGPTHRRVATPKKASHQRSQA